MALVVVSSACAASDTTDSGGDRASAATQPAIGTSGPEATTTEAAVPELLQFTAPLVGGGSFDGAAVAGTPTVFWFWAPT